MSLTSVLHEVSKQTRTEFAQPSVCWSVNTSTQSSNMTIALNLIKA